MLSLLRQIIVLAFVVCLSSFAARAADWQVERSTAGVNFTVDRKTWFSLRAGLVVPNNAWISTGPRGRLTLTRGVERLSFEPKTLAAVMTKQGLLSRKTEVVQQKGQIALDIEKRGTPHTYVQTPFLAAVVKGTSFTVTVTDRNASVSVERGLVQVSSFTGGQSTNVGPGQQATVDQAQTMTVAGNTAAPSISSVEPTQSAVRAVGEQAPIGAGLGLSGFTGQGNDRSGTGNAGQNGVDGESSEGGSSGRGNGGGSGSHGHAEGKGEGAGNGHGSGENGQGNGHANGNGGGGGGGNGNGNAGNGNGAGNGNVGNGQDNGNGNAGNGGDDDDDDGDDD